MALAATSQRAAARRRLSPQPLAFRRHTIVARDATRTAEPPSVSACGSPTRRVWPGPGRRGRRKPHTMATHQSGPRAHSCGREQRRRWPARHHRPHGDVCSGECAPASAPAPRPPPQVPPPSPRPPPEVAGRQPTQRRSPGANQLAAIRAQLSAANALLLVHVARCVAFKGARRLLRNWVPRRQWLAAALTRPDSRSDCTGWRPRRRNGRNNATA